MACFGCARSNKVRDDGGAGTRSGSDDDVRGGRRAAEKDEEAARLLSCAEACLRDGCGVNERTAVRNALARARPASLSAGGDRVVQMRAKAVNKAIDALLKPVLDAAERFLDATPSTRNDGGMDASWDTATPRDVLDAIRASYADVVCARSDGQRDNSGGAMSGNSQEELLAMGTGFGVLRAMFESLPAARHNRKLKRSFYNSSLNRIASMLTTVVCRKVILEDQTTMREYKEEWERFCAWMGITTESLRVCMQPTSRSLFVYIDTIAEHGQRKLNVKVHRSHVLDDIHADVEKAMHVELEMSKACKVFPSFYEAALSSTRDAGTDIEHLEQGEGHGPRREFFQLVGTCACSLPAPNSSQEPMTSAPTSAGAVAEPILSYRRSAGAYWINESIPRSPSAESAFRAFGWIAGQCISNRCTLGVSLPATFFQSIIDGDAFAADEHELAKFDPDAAKTIGLVRDLNDRVFAEMLELDGLDARPGPDRMSREDYISLAARRILVLDVRWQMECVRAGFWAAAESTLLVEKWGLDGEDLADVVCGTAAAARACVGGLENGDSAPDFAIDEIFRVVLGDDMQESQELWNALSGVLADLTPEQKLAFVAFVTGMPRLPEPLTEILKIELPFVPLGSDERKSHIGMLPQSHTCENTLELPNYLDALVAHVDEKVKDAVGGTRQSRAVSSGSAPGDEDAHRRSATVETIAELTRHFGLARDVRTIDVRAYNDTSASSLRAAFLRALLKNRLLLAMNNCRGYQLDDL